MKLTLPRLLKLQIKKYRFQRKKRRSKRNMENFCKNWFCQNFSCCPKKSELPKIWEGKGGGGGGSPPAPPARTLMGAITCFFMQTHYNFSQIWYQRVGSVICTIIKCRQILNTPPQDKFESNMRRLKRFILFLFWNGSNNKKTEIELRTVEHFITDYIELSFSICLVWSELVDFVAQIFLRNFLNMSETLVCWSVRASLVNW